ARGVMYARGEYLLWWLEGMDTPALVTQFSAINPNNGSAIGPFTTLFGRNQTLKDERSGGRVTLGLWLDDYGQWGVEGEYLALADLEESFVAGVRDGSAPAIGSYIGRPFFNTGVIGAVLPGGRGPAVEDVDTNALDGTVTVDMRSEFQSASLRLRHNLCCREGSSTSCGSGVDCGGGVGCGSGVGNGSAYPFGPLNRLCNLLRKGTRRTDMLYGVRWTNLNESIRITEDLQTLTAPISQLDVIDSFATENEFIGGEIGYETDWRFNRWSLRFLTKVAIGNTRQRVDINGSTVIDDVAVNPPDNIGGLLAQRYVLPDGTVVGNIGTYERDEFSMIPEIGLTAGYNLTPRLKLTAGYTLLYWSNIVRPGEQIDLDVNANLLPRDGGPGVDTVVAGDHPRFEFRQTDLWATGVNFGAEYTW
ncbi:MAG: BBP7 family outer membrane beta-barrel protein, partial [Planctomycetes bacterium]|nr:BBP7 family outer membrane beta-barrel protein [Planctomycetota bacterium]